MKKLLAVFMALLMASSLCLTSLAAETDAPAAAPFVTSADRPYKDGVNIWLNGRFMTFTDAVPAVVGDRTQAPYRAVLEAMGAEVSYDDGKIEAKFEDGSVMNLAIGSKTMTYTKGGKVNTVEMDVAPYIDNASGRTFVPIRFIGETLGMTVTWDPEFWIAYVVDWDALEASVDSRFSAFNNMMADLMKLQPDDGNVKSHDRLALSFKMAEADKPIVASIEGDTITDGVSSSGTYTLGLDFGGLEKVLGEESAETLAQIKEVLDGVKFDLIVAAGENNADLYIRSQLITAMTEGLVPQDGWLYVDIAGMYKEMTGLDITEIMQSAVDASAEVEDFTMGQLIRLLCEDGTMGQMMGGLAPDQTAEMYIAVYEGMFSDGQIKEMCIRDRRYTVPCWLRRPSRPPWPITTPVRASTPPR